MKRKALAVAVGALFVAPVAQAQITFGNDQIGTMQIYGKLYPQFGWFAASGATQPGSAVSTLSGSGVTAATITTLGGVGRIEEPPPRQLVDVGNSYIGFRGERGLGRGLKAIWQLEQSTNFDVGTGTFGSRDSFVGLNSGSFGTLRLGNMDTVYKSYGDQMSMFGIASGNFVSGSNILSQSIGSNRAGRFHERRNSSIMYETPTFSGFTGGIMYGPAEDKSGGTTARNQNLWSYGVKWDSERFYASVHQEKHQDFFGLSNNIANTALRNIGATGTPLVGAHSDDKATRFSAEFRLPNMRFVFDVSRLEYEESGQIATAAAPKVASYKHNTYGLGWDGGFGPWRFATQFIRAGEGECTLTSGTCSTAGLGATLWTVGVRWRFDRQTFVYAIGAILNNGLSAAFNNSAPAINIGDTTKNFAMGISYSF